MYAKPEIKSCNYYESFFNGFSIKVTQPHCPINKILIGTINAYTATTIIIKAHRYNIDHFILKLMTVKCPLTEIGYFSCVE